MIKDILNGDYDDDLGAIADAVKIRKQRKAEEIAVGTRVRVTNIRPKYLIGATGVVKGRNRTTFNFQFDDNVDTGRYSRNVKVPMTSVEVI